MHSGHSIQDAVSGLSNLQPPRAILVVFTYEARFSPTREVCASPRKDYSNNYFQHNVVLRTPFITLHFQ